MSSIQVESYDSNDIQYLLNDAIIVDWSNHYGEEGSGFGYCHIELPRKIGHDYGGIGYGHRLKLRKYLNTFLFDGQIRQIEDSSSSSEDMIKVTALGWLVVAEDDEFLRAYCDQRLEKWQTGDPFGFGEVPKGEFRPDLFTTGSGQGGLYIHANNGADYVSGDLTALRYEFHAGEVAKRIKFDLSIMLGTGVAFEADVEQTPFVGKVASIDDGTKEVGYKDDTGEYTVLAGDTLSNVTQELTASIASIAVASNVISCVPSDDLSAWASDDNIEITTGRIWYANGAGENNLAANMVLYNLDKDDSTVISSVATDTDHIVAEMSVVAYWDAADEIYAPGPLFSAKLDSIAGASVTYREDVGETLLNTDYQLVNLTKKQVAGIAAASPGADTINVDDSDQVLGWEEGDSLLQPTNYFWAKVSGATAGTTVTYKSSLGVRLVKYDVGWVVWNETEDNFATIASWDVASNQFDVTDAGDLTGWSDNDVLRIGVPFRFAVQTEDGTVWPQSEAGDSYRMHEWTACDVTPGGSPTYFLLVLENYISGRGQETAFVQLANIRAYSTDEDVNPILLGNEVVSLLSESYHGLDSATDDIDDSLTALTEPMVLEFNSPKEAMIWLCSFGDGSGNKLAWGVRLDDDKKFFLEVQDLDTIKYVIKRNALAKLVMGGDVHQSTQAVRGVYTDIMGVEQVTDWSTAPDAAFNSNMIYRTIQLDSVDNETDAQVALDLYLAENKYPTKRASFSVNEGAVTTPAGANVSVDELKATGDIMLLEDWRSVEAGRSGTDLRDNFTREQLVAVKVNYRSGSAELIPAGATSTFESYMAALARMAGS